MVKKANAVKKAVTSKEVKKPNEAKLKSVGGAKGKKPRAAVVQENLKAFAFPTTASMTEAAPPVPELGALVKHPEHGQGIFEGLVTVGTAAVLFDKHETPINVPVAELKPALPEMPVVGTSGIDSSTWAKTKRAKLKKAPKDQTPEQEMKRAYKLIIGDEVNVPGLGDVCTITQVVRDEASALRVTSLPSASEIPVTCFAAELTKVEAPAKLVFRDVNLFAAFVVRNRTFVKIGNSTAIAAHVRGSVEEPFAMLATANSKIAKSAKRSFKQSDKVSAFVAQQ